ncbi:MAG: hypothetical protein RMJ84_07510 [Sandaracinaceae bacterium]|nr:hypothetical protein [Sandaracinaceae bacterium]
MVRAAGGSSMEDDPRLDRGLELYAIGQEEEAIALWREVLREDPENPRAIDYLQAAGALPLVDVSTLAAFGTSAQDEPTPPLAETNWREEVLRLVEERNIQGALARLYEERRRDPTNQEIKASIQHLKEYQFHLLVLGIGGMDRVLDPSQLLPPRNFEEATVAKLVDGESTVEDIVLVSPLGKNRTIEILLRLLGEEEKAKERLPKGLKWVWEKGCQRVAFVGQNDAKRGQGKSTLPPPQGEEDHFEAELRRGIRAAIAGHYDEAEAAFERALALRPGDRRVLFNLISRSCVNVAKTPELCYIRAEMHIVVIEPDPHQRARLARELSKARRGVGVVAFSAFEEAIEALEDSPLMVVIGVAKNDAHQVGDWVEQMQKKWGSTKIAICIEDPKELLDITVTESLRLFGRPPSIDRLILFLRSEVGVSQQDLPSVALTDLIQMACSGGYTVRITCTHKEREVGTVDVVQGKLVSARDGQGRGIPALSRLIGLGVRARLRKLEEEPPRDIDEDWQFALFEAVRLADESPPQETFEELMQKVTRALIERDYAKAAIALSQAARLRPDEPLVRINLERLRKMGFSEGGDGQ